MFTSVHVHVSHIMCHKSSVFLCVCFLQSVGARWRRVYYHSKQRVAGRVKSDPDMVASYGRALAWSTGLVKMLVVRARKICSEICSHFNSRTESTKVVAKVKSNKPTKVKTKFEAIKFLLKIVKLVPGN